MDLTTQETTPSDSPHHAEHYRNTTPNDMTFRDPPNLDKFLYDRLHPETTSNNNIRGEILREPSRETPTKDTPTKYTPTKDTPTKDTPTKDTPTKDTPTKDTPTKDTPTKDTPTRDTYPKDTRTRDKHNTNMSHGNMNTIGSSKQFASHENTPSRNVPPRKKYTDTSHHRETSYKETPYLETPADHTMSDARIACAINAMTRSFEVLRAVDFEAVDSASNGGSNTPCPSTSKPARLARQPSDHRPSHTTREKFCHLTAAGKALNSAARDRMADSSRTSHSEREKPPKGAQTRTTPAKRERNAGVRRDSSFREFLRGSRAEDVPDIVVCEDAASTGDIANCAVVEAGGDSECHLLTAPVTREGTNCSPRLSRRYTRRSHSHSGTLCSPYPVNPVLSTSPRSIKKVTALITFLPLS